MKIYANPVGKIKKDIYIIKNDINNKVYIGQSINSENRFKSHCKPNKDNSLIDKAIQKYGKNHFWYEILESQIYNYNEREIFWISYFNSITPNGYNILKGGDEPPRFLGENHPSVKISDNEVLLLKKDLKNTQLSLSEIAKKYNISKKHVLRINNGISRTQKNEEYPIRKIPNINGKLTEQTVDEIIELLKYTYFFSGEIAKRYNVSIHTINDINSGIHHRRENIQYPIRNWKSCGLNPLTYEQVSEIIDKIKNSNISLSALAKDYNVTLNLIQLINNGKSKKYHRNNLTYPIRPFN